MINVDIVLQFFVTYYNDISSYVFNANQRVFWLYLLACAPLALIAYNANKSRTPLQPSFITYLFSRKIWLHPSAKHDYAIFLINRALKLLGVTVSLVLMAPLAIGVSSVLEQLITLNPLFSTSPNTVIVCFTLILFVFDDFTRFFTHYLLHKIPALWEFHKVHHSAKVLTPITIYRSHPVESLIFATRMAATQGLAVGLSYFLFGPTLAVFDVLGANVVVFAFNVMGANLRHSHVWLSWGDRLEKILISPAQHQIHHSNLPRHFDTNFGSALAIWDRLFNSYLPASVVADPSELRFGISRTNNEHTSLIEIYFKPFALSLKQLGKLLSRK